jgi:membrane protein YdbS with pleckstrin-like domain
MRLPNRLLADDEELILAFRPHWRSLIGPVGIVVTTVVAAWLLASITSLAWWTIPLLAGFAIVGWVIVPVVRWYTTSFILTDRRLITREGALMRRGHDVPLSRIRDVSVSRGVLERLVGSGTLAVEYAGERELEIPDVPEIEAVQRKLNELIDALPEARAASDPLP